MLSEKLDWLGHIHFTMLWSKYGDCESKAGVQGFVDVNDWRGLQNNSDTKLEFDVKKGAHVSVQPVIYSFSAVSSLRRTLRGFVVMGGHKLRLTLKPT